MPCRHGVKLTHCEFQKKYLAFYIFRQADYKRYEVGGNLMHYFDQNFPQNFFAEFMDLLQAGQEEKVE